MGWGWGAFMFDAFFKAFISITDEAGKAKQVWTGKSKRRQTEIIAKHRELNKTGKEGKLTVSLENMFLLHIIYRIVYRAQQCS